MADLEHRRRLGEELRQVRLSAGATTRQVSGISSSHISLVENGQTLPSSDFVETYIHTLGGDRITLYALLDAAVAESNRIKTARRRERHMNQEPTEQPDIFSPSVIKRSYMIETKDSTYRFNSDGVIEEVRMNYVIRARATHTSLFYEGLSYSSDRRRGVLTAEAGQGCHVEHVQETDNGSVQIYFSLDREIDPEDREPYAFSFRVLVNSPIRADPELFYMPGAATVLRYAVHAQFVAPALPAPIWWFATEGHVAALANEQPERVFPPDLTGYYFKEFHKLINGWCYGFGWKWPPA